MKSNKITKLQKIDTIFVIIVFFVFIVGLLCVVFNSNKINYYENRTAYQTPQFNLNEILNGNFQNNIELAFSDQLPFSTNIKKGYNLTRNFASNIFSNIIFENTCDKMYIRIDDSLASYGCNKNLVYYGIYVKNAQEEIDNRIKNINKTLKATDINTYIYYIEKDSDIDFVTNKKTDIYSYLKKNINTNNIYHFAINNFAEFSQYFYKTDHHWNYKGSYKAYTELVNILTDDNPLKPVDEICLNNNFSGSKASISDVKNSYKESFCVYKFNYPDYTIMINGNETDYGNEEYYLTTKSSDISYANYYGNDFGEIIIDNHDNSKPNILILGDSYDNAILKLLASHFNKTYSVDLRSYKRENGKEFEYTKYLKENNIHIVLLIGNYGFFKSNDFNMEV